MLHVVSMWGGEREGLARSVKESYRGHAVLRQYSCGVYLYVYESVKLGRSF